ncbi:MAG: SpoIIE family protein phosphatase, partial [Spirochaetes bacterium]|nr:SpoIIE family protein phosphatase [Spirochaetota bacterium]
MTDTSTIMPRAVAGNPMHRIILLCSLLLAAMTCSCGSVPMGNAGAPRAVRGVLDLSGWDLARMGPVELAGEWGFRWNSFDDPDAPPTAEMKRFITVPGTWNGYLQEGKRLSGHGFATYRLRVRIANPGTPLALNLPAESTAFRLFIDGREVASAGVPGMTEETSEPAYRPMVVDFVPHGDVISIVMHISNFHYRKGGVRRSILLGVKETITALHEEDMNFTLFLFGSLIMMGLYHLALFALRRNDPSPLFFGLMCLAFALRAIATNDYYIVTLFPGIPFDLVIKMEYLSIYLAVPIFGIFFYSLYPQEIPRSGLIALLAVCAPFILLAAVAPPAIFTYSMPPFQAIVLMYIAYCTYLLVLAMKRRRDGALIFIVTFVVIALTAVNDILSSNIIVATRYMLPFAFMFFIFAQAFLLSRRFAGAFTSVERLSAEVQEKNAELTRLDATKDEFLANTSHELKTPLNGIIGIAESLVDGAAGPLNEVQSENLRMISSSGKRLATLVNDLLDVSRLKNQEVILHRGAVDLWQAAEIVISISKPLVAAKGLLLVNDIPQNIPMVLGDENRIQQILHNLIGNAIKFTASGSVTVTASSPGAGGDGFVTVSVSDTGIGIPGDRHEGIFRSFEQADGSIEREFGGTGLGLTITKSLVELHDGRIWVVSEQGKGSTFSFTLPVYTPGSGAAENAGEGFARRDAVARREEVPQSSIVSGVLLDESREPALIGFHRRKARGGDRPVVLAVDDDPVNLQVVINYLEQEGYRVLPALSGYDALEMIKEEVPDIILLDLMMPKMSGYEAARRIRNEHSSDRVPIVFLTARDRPDDLEKGFECGGNDYITKPFSRGELIARVGFHVAMRRAIRENSELRALERELEMVRRMRRTAPNEGVPLSPHYQISVLFMPSERIGGDFHDFHLYDDDKLLAILSNVSGHGVTAAYIASMIGIVFRSVKNKYFDPGMMLGDMSAILSDIIENHFISARAVWIDPEAMILTGASAGQTPILLYGRQRGELRKITPRGRVIGMTREENFDSERITYESGDRVVLFTDGITDVHGGGESGAFGGRRLESFVMKHRDLPVQEFTDRLSRELTEWAGGNPSLKDDITVI